MQLGELIGCRNTGGKRDRETKENRCAEGTNITKNVCQMVKRYQEMMGNYKAMKRAEDVGDKSEGLISKKKEICL